ncbi:MFS transporter [Rhodococcus globerulus]|uniref:MFS transporter n=1 Tax=Rhodococcus globerulus TaxID=33008 RepID=UPI00301A019C
MAHAKTEIPNSKGPGLNATLIIICQSMQALAFGGVALFLPLIREDVNISFSQAGTLAAISTFTYAICQVPAGYLADRYDPKRLFVVGLIGVNLLSAMFAVLDDYGMLLANQAVSGVFRALIFAPGLLLMQQQFRPDRAATAMGLYVAGGFSSNILLNALGPALVGPLGWRWLFIAFSLSGLLVLFAFAALGDSVVRPPKGTPTDRADLKTLLRYRVVWLSGFIQFVRLAVVTGVAFWLPSMIVEDKGFSLGIAGAVVAIGAAVTAPSNFLGGWMSDRLDRPLLVIGTSLAMLAITLAIIPLVDSLGILIAVIAVNSVFVQLYFGPLFAVPLQHVGRDNAGVLSGFGNFCANLGGFAFTFGLGAIKESTGSFDIGFWVLAGLCVAGLLTTGLIARIPVEPKPTEDILDSLIDNELVHRGGVPERHTE